MCFDGRAVWQTLSHLCLSGLSTESSQGKYAWHPTGRQDAALLLWHQQRRDSAGGHAELPVHIQVAERRCLHGDLGAAHPAGAVRGSRDQGHVARWARSLPSGSPLRGKQRVHGSTVKLGRVWLAPVPRARCCCQNQARGAAIRVTLRGEHVACPQALGFGGSSACTVAR